MDQRAQLERCLRLMILNGVNNETRIKVSGRQREWSFRNCTHTYVGRRSPRLTAQESSNAKNGVTIMASSKEYLHFILEQLSDLDDMPRPGGIRVGSSSSSSSGSSPPIISEHVISTSPISSGALPCMSGRSYTLCVSATCRSSRIALGERPTACPSPLRRAFLPPSLCCTAKAA